MEIMRKLFQKILIVCWILLSISVFTEIAKACSCYPIETVEKELAKTPNVLILKLQSVKQNAGEATNFFLSIEKVFKGNLKIGDVLIFKVESNCSWMFSEDEIGNKFLFYLGERPAKDEKWVGSICSRSGRVNSKTNDLSFLENQEKLRGKTRLSGKLDKFIQNLDELQTVSFEPLANRQIRITGNGKNIKLVTDENGFYEIYDLPLGKYKITPEKIDGFIFSSDNLDYAEVEIKARSHTEENFLYSINNEISGKVVDRKGKPIEDVCVNLVSQKTGKALILHESRTDKEGKFEITSIPPGTYKIVINQDSEEMSLNSPNPKFMTFYYPNVQTEKEAAEITVEANYFLRNLKLVPPTMLETILLTGRLLYSDGKPATDERIQFVTAEEISESSRNIVVSDFEVKTDKAGKFSLEVLKGKSGVLRGIFYSFLGDDEICPEIKELLKPKGNGIQGLETNRFEIAATENVTEIELKFPFSSCKKAKQENEIHLEKQRAAFMTWRRLQ